MKKWVISICFCILLVSVGLTFSACNSNASTENVAVSSVVFEQRLVYAEYQERIALRYKVYPSNATPTNVNFSYKTKGGKNITLNESLLSQGIVYINKPQNVENSGEVEITINVDGKTDVCTVQLKPYPNKDGTNKDSISLNIPENQTLSVVRGQSIQLPLMVTNDFGTNKSPFEMYHFTFTTSNGISVNENGVLFCAENYPYSTATIIATIKYNGRDDVVFDFEINVLPQKPQEVTLVHPSLGTISTEEPFCISGVEKVPKLNVYATNRVAGGTQQVPLLNVSAYALVTTGDASTKVSVSTESTDEGATLTLSFTGVTSGEALSFTLYIAVDGEDGPILRQYEFVVPEVTLVHSSLGTLSTKEETFCVLGERDTLELNVYATYYVAGGTQQVPFLNVSASALVTSGAAGAEVVVSANPTAEGATLTLSFTGVTSGEALSFTLYIAVDCEDGPMMQEYTFVVNFQTNL